MTIYFFFFNDTATTEIYTLSLHDALPICRPPPRARAPVLSAPDQSSAGWGSAVRAAGDRAGRGRCRRRPAGMRRSEEHTSELQSRQYLVCRLLLEKKKQHSYSH